jgi:hypothetical protein
MARRLTNLPAGAAIAMAASAEISAAVRMIAIGMIGVEGCRGFGKSVEGGSYKAFDSLRLLRRDRRARVLAFTVR